MSRCIAALFIRHPLAYWISLEVVPSAPLQPVNFSLTEGIVWNIAGLVTPAVKGDLAGKSQLPYVCPEHVTFHHVNSSMVTMDLSSDFMDDVSISPLDSFTIAP